MASNDAQIVSIGEFDRLIAGLEDGNHRSITEARRVLLVMAQEGTPPIVLGAAMKGLRDLAVIMAESRRSVAT